MSPKDSSDTKKHFRSAMSPLRRAREQRGWTQSGLAERIGTTQVNISRWEKGITTPGPYYRQKLGELFGKSIQELGFISESDEEQHEALIFPNPSASSFLQPIWHVPYRRNPFFTGREEILIDLYNEFISNQAKNLIRIQAIIGLGGIGKTQIAIEYAYRYRDHYQAIFWINVSTRDALSADFVTLAALLDLPEKRDENQDTVVRAVKRWLDNHTRWLLILDNVDSLEMIVDFLPVHNTGDVLLTTRMQALGTIAQGIEVDKMGLEEGVMLLLRRTRTIAPGASLDQAPEESLIQAREIVVALDGLPLALDQAGAYIEETRSGLPQYLDLYGKRRKELLLRRGRSPIDHPHSVVTTWSLSFQQVEQESRAAADLLCLLAFLNPEAIPEEVITLGAAEPGTELGKEARDPLKVDNIIELLLRYSLVRRTPEEQSLSMHHLVQSVLKDGMDKETQRSWAERAIRAVNGAFPHVEPKNVELPIWEICQRYILHVLICATYIEEYALVFPEAARLLNEAAFYLIGRGRYGQAESLLLMALAIRRQVLEVDHSDTARTLNGLGVVYFNQGRYQDAEPLLQEALAIRQKTLGTGHSDVAQTLYDLANLYRTQGFYMKAEPLYLQSLQIREAVEKIDPPVVAEGCYGLAKLYYSQEQYQKAEKYCKQALHIQEQSLRDNHPRIASTLNILAKIYQGQNELDRAEKMNMRALRIRESASGLDHPHVATIINSLVEIYHAEERYQEARQLIARSLQVHEQSLGSAHPFMAYSLSNLAENFFLQKDYVQAEFYYKKALTIREQNLGLNHPHTASSYYKLAQFYAALEQYADAELLYRKSLSIREYVFGADHPVIASTLVQYAVLLRKLKRVSEADILEARIHAIKAKQVTSENP